MEKYMSKNYAAYEEAAKKKWFFLKPIVEAEEDLYELQWDQVRDSKGKFEFPRRYPAFSVTMSDGKRRKIRSWHKISEGDIVVLNRNANIAMGAEMGRANGRVSNIKKGFYDSKIWQVYTDDVPGQYEVDAVSCFFSNYWLRDGCGIHEYRHSDDDFVSDGITKVILACNTLANISYMGFNTVREAKKLLNSRQTLNADRFLKRDFIDGRRENLGCGDEFRYYRNSFGYDGYRIAKYSDENKYYGKINKVYNADKECMERDDSECDNEYKRKGYYYTFNLIGCYPGWREKCDALSIWKQLNGKSGIRYDGNGRVTVTRGDDEIASKIKDDNEFGEFYNELIFRSAFSILIRGGFVNLLEAGLSANPPIGGFIDDLCKFAEDIGSVFCLEVLEKYRHSDENIVNVNEAKAAQETEEEKAKKLSRTQNIVKNVRIAVEKVNEINVKGKNFCSTGLTSDDMTAVLTCLNHSGGTYTDDLELTTDYLIVDTENFSQKQKKMYTSAWKWRLDGKIRTPRIISLKSFYELCVIPSGFASYRNELPSDDDATKVCSIDDLLPQPKGYSSMDEINILNDITRIQRETKEQLGEYGKKVYTDDMLDKIEKIDFTNKSFCMPYSTSRQPYVMRFVEARGGLKREAISSKTDYLIVDDLDDSITTHREYDLGREYQESGKNVKLKIISFLQFCDLCGIGTDSPIVPDPVEMQNKDEKKSAPVTPTPESAPISEEPTCDEPSDEEETEPAPEPAAEPAPEAEAPCDPESSMIPADAEGEPLSASGMSFTEALGTEWFVVTPAGKKFRKQCIVFPDGRRCEFNTQYDHTPEDVVVIGGDGKYFGMIGRPDFSGAPVTEYDTDSRVRFVFRKDPTEEDVRKMSRRLTSLSNRDASMKRYISENVGDEDVFVDIVNDYIERELIACALVNNRFASEKLRSKARYEASDSKKLDVLVFWNYLKEINGSGRNILVRRKV